MLSNVGEFENEEMREQEICSLVGVGKILQVIRFRCLDIVGGKGALK